MTRCWDLLWSSLAYLRHVKTRRRRRFVPGHKSMQLWHACVTAPACRRVRFLSSTLEACHSGVLRIRTLLHRCMCPTGTGWNLREWEFEPAKIPVCQIGTHKGGDPSLFQVLTCGVQARDQAEVDACCCVTSVKDGSTGQNRAGFL